MHFSNFLILAVLAVGSSLVSAAPIGSNWVDLINSLKNKGVEQIGAFNLSRFQARAAKVPFHPLGSAPPSVMAGARGSAFYSTAKPPQIYILSSLSDRDSASLAQLEIHELMGALGEGDADTAKSTALAVINATSDPGERAQLVQDYGRSIFKAQKKDSSFMVAGGFSVGGGGDIDLIRIKNLIFEFVRGQAGRDFASSEFARHFPGVNFEPLRKGSRVTLNYIFRFPSTELLSIYVPKGNEADLVREIAAKLVSIFPAKAHEAVIEIRPKVCRRGESMRVPRPSDAEVANIQEQRVRFLLGCKVVPQESGGVSTSGVTSDFAQPDRAGIFKFECGVQAPGQGFKLSLDSAKGAVGTMAKSGSLLTDSDSATFTLFADGDGRIIGARLAYQAARGQKEVQTLQRSQSPTSITVSLPNPQISMTCTAKP